MMSKVQRLFFIVVLTQVNGRRCLSYEIASHRKLSQEYFLSYEPVTVVTDQAAIDLDQQLMEKLLAEGNNQARNQAMAVYAQGAHSMSYAELSLNEALLTSMPKDTTVFGKTAAGNDVRGKTMEDYKQGQEVLQVQYHTSPVQASYVNCQVGANPDPVLDGCFANSGTVELDNLGNYLYNYNMTMSNFNARTLQGFSLQAKEEMYTCDKCPYQTYLKFIKYYGAFDYADQWVTAAYQKVSTNFPKGNANFAVYGDAGTAQVIQKGTVYMGVWMYVIRQMEYATNLCESDCSTTNCQNSKMQAWDAAVAYYTGSIPKTDKNGGVLLYSLAQDRCVNFGTCLDSGNEAGMAYINSEIFKDFREGQQNLQMGNCEAVKLYIAEITSLMSVPLIQSTLRTAYTMDKEKNRQEKSQAEGASFAAAVLPLVNHCSPADASLIYDNMKVGNNGIADFGVVKSAFERNYRCMGITCDHVGGLINPATGGYMEGGDPCGHIKHDVPIATAAPQGQTTSSANTGGNNGPNVGLAVGLTIGIVGGLIIIALLISRKSNQKEYDGPAESEMA